MIVDLGQSKNIKEIVLYGTTSNNRWGDQRTLLGGYRIWITNIDALVPLMRYDDNTETKNDIRASHQGIARRQNSFQNAINLHHISTINQPNNFDLQFHESDLSVTSTTHNVTECGQLQDASTSVKAGDISGNEKQRNTHLREKNYSTHSFGPFYMCCNKGDRTDLQQTSLAEPDTTGRQIIIMFEPKDNRAVNLASILVYDDTSNNNINTPQSPCRANYNAREACKYYQRRHGYDGGTKLVYEIPGDTFNCITGV